MPPPPAKAALRRALRARRAASSAAQSRPRSTALAAHLNAHPAWRGAARIAAFVGVRGEPDTLPLLQAALDRGQTLWLPRVLHGPAGDSELVQVPSLDRLAPARFGLLEPRPEPNERRLPLITSSAPLDLILVPGLAFSSRGARIGFGAGHYDRLLAPVLAADHPVRVGVCFADFLDPPEGPIPLEPHDVPMHYVATDAGVVRCDAP